MIPAIYASAGGTDLSGGWTKAWNAMTGSFHALVVAATIAGALIVAGGILHYLWQRKRGQAQIGPLLFTCVVGGILAGPNLLIPLFLKLIDQGIGMLASLLRSLG